MSGIAGLMTRDGEAPPSAILRAIAPALAHRGPDGDGHYRSGDVAMLVRRLAIVDLATGDQPIFEPGGAALIANGEIYNAAELRRELPDIAFAGGSDCEPALHLYRRHGLGFTRWLRGMYALALHDPVSGSLILARDPFGIKPLYFAETPTLFAFASEAHALVAGGIVGAALAAGRCGELLQMQFTTGRETIFAGISRVLPGETIVVRQGRIVERRHREALPAGGPLPADEDEAVARFDDLLADSVAAHLRADVPTGVVLSGSLDSLAVLAMAARLCGSPVQVLAPRFAGPEADAVRLPGRAVAAALGADWRDVAFDEEDFWQSLPAVAAAIDDPAADYAMLPAYKLGAAAREAGIKAVLSVEGGDELFGGYGRYRAVMRPWWAGGRKPRARGVLAGPGLLRADIAGWRDGIAAAEARCAVAGRSPLQVAQAVDCADWLPNDPLTRLDRCLMAHGIEGRAPFLDAALAEFAFRLPDDFKIRGGRGKWLLRRWLAQHVPPTPLPVRRPRPAPPVTRWIAQRSATIGPLVAASEGVRALCEPEGVRRVFAAAGQRHAGRAAWTLLFYALWHRRHIEGVALPPDTVAALAERG